MPKKSKALTVWTHSEEITWYNVRDKLPDFLSGQRGTQVLIWPPHVEHGYSDFHVAFFGDWITMEPWFYMYGATLDRVENWAYLPKGPAPGVKPSKAAKPAGARKGMRDARHNWLV